jgi:C1A family cysteine protease
LCGERLHFSGDQEFDVSDLPEVLSFDDWRKAFGKIYSSQDELQHRTRIFSANLDLIRHHNNGSSTFRMGVNQFTDLNHSEFKARIVPAKFPSPDAPHNTKWLPITDDLTTATIDWRTKGAVTPVKNQAKCGSCWAFSTTGSVEGAFFLATGELRSASEQQLVDCSVKFGNHGCSGGLMDNGFKYIIANKGIDR